MALAKNYKRYASGGRNRNLKLDTGIRAMQEESDRRVQALKGLEEQNRIQSRQRISDLESKEAKEANNRKLLNDIEVQKPRQLREKAIKQNAEVRIKNHERQAAENDKLAKVWAGLSPTLAKSFEGLVQQSELYMAKTGAIDDFNELIQSGKLAEINKLHSNLKSQANSQEFMNLRHEAYRTGDKIGGDYLTNTMKINNRFTKAMIYNDLEKNFDNVIQPDFHRFLQDNNLYKKEDILRHYQFRAVEFLQQYGIKPDSEIGLKVQQLFRNKGAVVENQMYLGHDYETHSEIIDTSKEELKALIKTERPNEADYVGDSAGYEKALKTYYSDANAIFIKGVTSQNQLPLKGKNGMYSVNMAPNMRASIDTYLKNNLSDVRYTNGESNESGFEIFKEEMLGVNKDNPLGYLIPGAPVGSTKKSDYLLGKFPNLEQEMKEEWQKQNATKLKTMEALKDDEQKAIGNQFETRINNGEFKGEMKWDGKFWTFYEQHKGNKYVTSIANRYLGLSGDNINYDSAIVQAIRTNNIQDIATAWTMMDEKGSGYTDKEQKLELAYKNWQELANHFKVDISQLDDFIDTSSKGIATDMMGRDSISKSKTITQEGVTQKVTALLLATYSTMQGENAEDRWNKSLELVKSMAGYGDGKTLQINSFDDNSVRGWGPLRHKQVGSQIIFTNSAEAGRNYNGITELEINDMLSDENNTIFDDETEVNYSNLDRLSGVVQYAMREHSRSGEGISDQDLYDYLTTGSTKNELLNHIVKDRLGKKIPVSEFKRSLEPLLDAKFYNKVVMMDGDEWCNYKFGPGSVHLSPQDKPTAMCVQKIEKDLGVSAWEVLVDDKVREKLNNMLQERN
tara:strand:+ start:1246 stop:3795 length:2550 start_codon:yes stop_codon:yes gene_type:complete